ncbi:MAG: hypothetical protein IKT78_01135 [Ruminiclostridium sp.]|nr:hypothetical protein [Ruminiclostridium sp.]
MSIRQPEVTSRHINTEDGDILIFTVRNSANKIGICRLNSARDDMSCLYAYDEPVVMFSSDSSNKYADIVVCEMGSMTQTSIMNLAVREVYDQLCAGAAFEYSLPALLKMMPDGLYAVSWQKCYPTTGENMFFWSGYGVSKQLKCSSRYIKLIDENKTFSAPFLIPTAKPITFEASSVSDAAERCRRGDALFGISIHLSGFYSVLIKGHHAACAAVVRDEPFYTVQLQRVRDLWKEEDENGEIRMVGLCSESFKIPFSALDPTEMSAVLANRAYRIPDTYHSLKRKMASGSKPLKTKGVPAQYSVFCESYPDADMIASAQGIDELTPPMLEALLMGETKLGDEIIISENYYSSVTAACNYLRYHNTNDFLTFAFNIMKNPELSATYAYVVSCMAKLHDKRVKEFFMEIIASDDPGYAGVLSVAKSYLQNYAQREQEISREDYAKTLPKAPERFDRKSFVSLTGASEQIKSGEGAELIAKHLSNKASTGDGAELIAKHITSMVNNPEQEQAQAPAPKQ